jgi:hypothetical protein
MTRNGGRMVQGPTESTALDRIRTFVDQVNEVDCIRTKKRVAGKSYYVPVRLVILVYSKKL